MPRVTLRQLQALGIVPHESEPEEPDFDGGDEIHIAFMDHVPQKPRQPTAGPSRRPTMEEVEDEDDPTGFHIRTGHTKAQELAEAAETQKPKRTLEEMVPSHYLRFRSVFEETASERLPGRRPYDHAIDMKPDWQPKGCKIYPLHTPSEEKALDEFHQEMLRRGLIRESKSPQASPFFFVKKKDGKLRPVQDYRELNRWTVKNDYPLPPIDGILRDLEGSSWFSKMDVRWGYNNIRIKEGDEWKAAFKTRYGLFEPTVMFFGLTNSPATFQAMMNHIFRDLIDARKVAVYMDDILVFTNTLDEHREIVAEVLRRLRDNDLYLKPEKCSFEQHSIEYLGFIIENQTIRMDPVKVDGILKWPNLTNVTDIRSFLGFGNFYRRFILHFAELAAPLIRLTCKDVPWQWGVEELKAFNALKRAFTEAPVLLIPDPTKEFRVLADSSGYGTGGVLEQQDSEG